MHLTEWRQEPRTSCAGRGSNDSGRGYLDEEGTEGSFARKSNSAKVGGNDGPRRVWESQFETHDLLAERGQSEGLPLPVIHERHRNFFRNQPSVRRPSQQLLHRLPPTFSVVHR